jgi:putative sterol carrier protein
MPAPFTDAWARACCAALDASAEYRAATGDRAWSIALACDAEPAAGLDAAAAVDFELADGRCRAARATTPDAATADVVLRGSYATWKAVVEGVLDPVAAVMSGRLAVERGSLMSLMPLVGPARALLAVARTVPTDFPGETAPAA